MFQGYPNHQNSDILVPRNHAIRHQLSQDLQKYSWQAPRALGKDAKQAAKQPAWCQEVITSSRARPSALLTGDLYCCLGALKWTILQPRYQDGNISRKHTICYTLATFCRCQSHQNIDVFVPRITHKAASQLRWTTIAAKRLSWCQLSGQAGAKMSAKLAS